MYKFTFFTICIQFWNNFSHFFSTKKISFELCKILRASLLKMRSHCIFYMHEEMLDNGRILHLICRTKQRKVVRDDVNSRDLVSMTASLRNPTSWGRQPSDTYKSYDYASRDTAHGPAVDSKKMRLDWSRWYIAVHFRVSLTLANQERISYAIARKFTFVASAVTSISTGLNTLRIYLTNMYILIKTACNAIRGYNRTVSLIELIFWLFQEKWNTNIKKFKFQ